MIKMTTQKGLTLTELLVASFLMGIVMVGIAGFSVTIKRMQDTTDKQAILAIQTIAAMTHMERNISRTIGGQSDQGYASGNAGTPNRAYWSFRQDPSNTPYNTSDDTWRIYFRRTTGGAPTFELRTCVQPAGAGAAQGPIPSFLGSDPCGQPNIQRVINKIQSFSIVQTVNNSPSTLDFYYTATITARFNPSAAAEPIDNPDYTLSTRVHAPGHSWN